MSNQVTAVENETPTQEELEKSRLAAIYGDVWTTDEATNLFEFKSFMAPFVSVVRKSDRKQGTIAFQHSPRFYFDFTE